MTDPLPEVESLEELDEVVVGLQLVSQLVDEDQGARCGRAACRTANVQRDIFGGTISIEI